MSTFKCKMCGGDLDITAGVTVCECEYCGSKQTVPAADNEKKMTLFGRANRLLRGCEFDKAAGIFESIVVDFPEEAEAYWGLVLCKYGIEYVDDPATARKVPTSHRSSFESVMDDANFDQACENADSVARRVYRDEAKAIEELRKGIIEVSGKEEPYDIFICYKETAENGERTLDSVMAQDVYDALTEKGYRVFFSRVTLEDKLGQEYEPYIFAALNSAKVMLAFGTDYDYYNAVWVKNEWSRFLQLIAKGEKKTLIPCYKGLDAYDLPKEFAKLQAQDMGKVGAMQDLLRGISKILPKETATATEKTTVSGDLADIALLLMRAFMFLEDGRWQDADDYCERALDKDPENAEAYLGKLMAELNVSKKEELKNCDMPLNDNINYQKVVRFGNETLKKELESYNEVIVKRNEKAQEETRLKEIAEREAKLSREEKLAPIREYIDNPACRVSISTGGTHTIGLCADGSVVACGRNDAGQCDVQSWQDIVAVSARGAYTVGLRADGSVVACGDNEDGQCNVQSWKDVVAIATGDYHTVGVCADGSVVACGGNKFGQCDVQSWKGVVAISTGRVHTIGLRADGSVVACGNNKDGRCDVQSWQDIVAISVGAVFFGNYTIGLRADGSVVACGDNENGQCNVQGWKDIVAISAGQGHTVGLRADGSVVACGNNDVGQCDVQDWQDIVAISTGSVHTIGLRADGSVVACGDNKFGQCDVQPWQDIVAISVCGAYTVGLRADGSVVACGYNEYGQCNVQDWKLFEDLNDLRDAIKKAETAKESKRQEKLAQLNAEKEKLQEELQHLKGLFAESKRNKIEAQIAEIDAKLEKLG